MTVSTLLFQSFTRNLQTTICLDLSVGRVPLFCLVTLRATDVVHPFPFWVHTRTVLLLVFNGARCICRMVMRTITSRAHLACLFCHACVYCIACMSAAFVGSNVRPVAGATHHTRRQRPCPPAYTAALPIIASPTTYIPRPEDLWAAGLLALRRSTFLVRYVVVLSLSCWT